MATQCNCGLVDKLVEEEYDRTSRVEQCPICDELIPIERFPEIGVPSNWDIEEEDDLS